MRLPNYKAKDSRYLTEQEEVKHTVANPIFNTAGFEPETPDFYSVYRFSILKPFLQSRSLSWSKVLINQI